MEFTHEPQVIGHGHDSCGRPQKPTNEGQSDSSGRLLQVAVVVVSVPVVEVTVTVVLVSVAVVEVSVFVMDVVVDVHTPQVDGQLDRKNEASVPVHCPL